MVFAFLFVVVAVGLGSLSRRSSPPVLSVVVIPAGDVAVAVEVSSASEWDV